MDRTVPRTASDEIELYLRTIYSLLRSTAEVQIRALEEVHAGVNSSLHPDVRLSSPDMSALIYSILRLPDCMLNVRSVILGQSAGVFAQHQISNVESWEPVSARARRRRCFFNGIDTLACYIASRSDIEDLIPVLTAYQIEWNKLHFLLKRCPAELLEPEADKNKENLIRLAEALEMSLDSLERLRVVWGRGFLDALRKIAARRCDLRIRLLAGSLRDYWRATQNWWDRVEAHCPDFGDRPVYFISSNTHSIANALSGFALMHREELEAYLLQDRNAALREEWETLEARQASRENFLYYVLKKYQQTPEGKRLVAEQFTHEQAVGITRVPSEHSFDVEAQIIEVDRLNPEWFDPRLAQQDWEYLKRSRAVILNIDYPLGLAAYNLLSKVAENAASILGVYVMGKAASLNSVRGDVMIPNVVQDEHSLNTYLFKNAFSAADVAPYLLCGSVLDNQKAVTVLGTFLQNARIMDVVYHEGYSDLEMEAGPYLSAIYEMARPVRHPVNEIVNLYSAGFDVGILHYVSDTPLSKGQNLGAGTLSYQGMDSTYATTLAILNRIFKRENKRLRD